MSRIALAVEYNGANFNGWQSQDHGRTVQDAVEKALSFVADQTIRVQCAGRTDSGVHAIHQIVHMDTDVEREMHSWRLGGNANLPHDVNICWAKVVDEEFHARFSAVQRAYRYVILNRSSRYSILNKQVTWEPRQLEIERMVEAARCLVGEHDFSSYRALACQAKSPVRTVSKLNLKRVGQHIVIDIEANAFLHHMVRNIAGVLMDIGMGKQAVNWAKDVLEARDRTLGGVTAPADGLYLVNVDYPESFAIPKADPSQWPLCLS